MDRQDTTFKHEGLTLWPIFIYSQRLLHNLSWNEGKMRRECSHSDSDSFVRIL